MQGALALLAVEARQSRPGGEAVITRLADILVIQAIRAWIDTAPAARTGWLGALRDAQIGRALALVHRDPATPWTVESLARDRRHPGAVRRGVDAPAATAASQAAARNIAELDLILHPLRAAATCCARERSRLKRQRVGVVTMP